MCFAKPLDASYTYAYIHIYMSVFFPTDMVMLDKAPIKMMCCKAPTEKLLYKASMGGALQSPYTEELYTAPIQRDLFTHKCIF